MNDFKVIPFDIQISVRVAQTMIKALYLFCDRPLEQDLVFCKCLLEIYYYNISFNCRNPYST
jgi:hypothetical protein